MRLHIGASRQQFANGEPSCLCTSAWVHLAEPDMVKSHHDIRRAKPKQIQGTWLPFYYRLGQTLPFPTDHFSFAFSEHFFEHLFLDEAGELMKECFRVLQPKAILRIAVPDADLRSYKAPEPVGYTTGDPRWSHPDKHKTRWSIYSLPWVLEAVGFRTRGVVYCDKSGKHVVRAISKCDSFYVDCVDQQIVVSTDYIRRFDHSLIVDAIKP